MRFPRLRNRQWAGPSGYHGQGHAGENEAGEDADRQDIFLYFLVAANVRNAEYNVLHLVVYSSTGLECCGLGCRGEVVEVRLEEPEGL